MANNHTPGNAIGECPNCGQRYYGLWVIAETHLKMVCPVCVKRDPDAGGKLVSMRIEPIPTKKGGEW